jgi:hypothetical protein
VIAKANENAECRHLDGLDAIMSSCDASILDEIPNDIVKLAACIVKRWWASHGFPYMTNAFHVKLNVRVFVTCCGVWGFLALTFVSLFQYWRRMQTGMDCELLMMSKVRLHALVMIARCL